MKLALCFIAILGSGLFMLKATIHRISTARRNILD